MIPNTVFLGIAIFILLSCNTERIEITDDAIPDTLSNKYRQITISADGRVEISAERLEVFSVDA